MNRTFLNNTNADQAFFSKKFVLAVLAISVLPFILNLLGVDFGSQAKIFPWPKLPTWLDMKKRTPCLTNYRD